MSRTLTRRWHDFALARPKWSQLIIFSALNVGMTVLQLVMMPLVRIWLGTTTLEDVTFRALPLGDYFIFGYPAGPIPEGGVVWRTSSQSRSLLPWRRS